MTMQGIIFDIKEFSIHDGPGSRITVFCKGCPLRCRWCHNPEGLDAAPQLSCKQSLCTGCGACRVPCGHAECRPFGRCLHACPNGCLSVAGERVEAAALARRLRESAELLRMLDGGITLSGGEPLMQPDFVCELADHLAGMHLALQTSGYAPPEVYRRVIARFDYIMQDIKLADAAQHRHWTGADNACILQNIDHLKRSGKDFVLRVPLIPDITDTEENLRAIAAIAGDAPVELLRYNPLAGAKYATFGMTYPLPEKTAREADLTAYFRNARMR